MRKFLVVLDDSRECLNAMRFAAMRASHTGGGVAVLSIIPPDEFNHWIGVGEVMREEARERIHAHFEVFAKWMRDKQHVEPELIIREGEAVTEIIAQVQEDPRIAGRLHPPQRLCHHLYRRQARRVGRVQRPDVEALVAKIPCHAPSSSSISTGRSHWISTTQPSSDRTACSVPSGFTITDPVG